MADTKYTYHGKVTEAGEIKLPGKRMRKELAGSFRGRGIEVTVRRKRKRRSNDQNAYYWGVVIPYVLRAFIHLGNDLQEGSQEHREIVHTMLKDKFLDNRVRLVDAHGQVEEVAPSTTRCTTTEMMEYIDRIQRWAAEYLDCVIPDPGEQVNFFAG